MSGFPPPPEGDRRPPEEDPRPAVGELDALRKLLFASEKKQIEGLRERIENPVVHARDVSEVLPRAVVLSASRDGQLADALTPAVTSALQTSIARDPSVVVNAIYPVIGPAVRKSIHEALAGLVQALNQTLEHSLSLQGLKWRWESIRTGRSFAEVVLTHTLLYRVEQIFLIHKPSGLLLLHLCAPSVHAQDGDMVSGMLTAIQDFAQDSFRTATGETLQTLEIGGLTVWVESSPSATLAAVIRGQAPYEFRSLLQRGLENICRQQGADLQAFSGDAAPFELARPHLEPCLQTQFTEVASRKSSLKLWLLGFAILLLLGLWGGSSVRRQIHWANYLERLKAEPGVVVTESGKNGRRYFTAGLRDPLAVEPASLLPQFGFDPARVDAHWEPYQALHPELVLKRARLLLQPPETIELQLRDGVLAAAGQAPRAWIEMLRARALALPGIQALDETGLAGQAPPPPEPLDPLVSAIRETRFLFDEGVRLVPGQEGDLEALAARFENLRRLAAARGQIARLAIVGHTDRVGTDEFNLRLSRERAGYIRGLLLARGLPAEALGSTGIGALESSDPDSPDLENPPDRRVTMEVVLEPALAPAGE